MREFKASTRQGQNIIDRANHYEGSRLEDVYGTCAIEKKRSFLQCYQMYADDVHATDFHICSHNNFMYSVAWLSKLNNERILRVETAKNSYLVWLER